MSTHLSQLIDALCCLPGVGPKSAQRIAFYLLQRNRSGAMHLSRTLSTACEQIRHCRKCRNFSDTEFCSLCTESNRDPSLLCIVESPVDVTAIEQTNCYRGFYFVLMGHLSPIDGIGPKALGVDDLLPLLDATDLKEVIIATNPTAEGEATAYYLANIIKDHGIRASRIAHGVPLGGELEFVDGNTLSQAILKRSEMH